MDILEFAMEKEKYSEHYYRQLAEKTASGGLAEIFNKLADDEAKHYDFIRQMKSTIPEDISRTDVLADAKEVFEGMRESTADFDFGISELELYEKARRIETDARDFYLKKADEVKDAWQKEIFRKLAQEEEKHYFLLDNIIEFVSRPQNWLENAEWYHLETY